MNENPYHNEPGFEAPHAVDSRDYNDIIQHETMRVAVCDMAGDSTTSRSMPDQLRSVVQSLFPNFLESYEIICASNRSRDGQV